MAHIPFHFGLKAIILGTWEVQVVNTRELSLLSWVITDLEPTEAYLEVGLSRFCLIPTQQEPQPLERNPSSL